MIAAGAIVLASLALGGIGLYLSFEHVAVFAYRDLGFQSLRDGRLFIGGVDTGILILIAVDLLMTWLRQPIGWIRYPVWLLTAATVVFNASTAAPSDDWTLTDYVATFAHALVPCLFIVVVEVARTAIDRIVRKPADDETDGVPPSRWVLDFGETFGIWRKTKLWGLSYTEVVAREQELKVYRVMLEREHGRVRKAPSDALLPFQMAPYGLTVDEALALPQEAKEREQRRREAEEERRIAEQKRAEERAAGLQRTRLRAAGSVDATRHEVEAETHQAQARAAAALTATERAVQAEEEAAETAAAAEAKARAAAAEKQAAVDRQAAAETERAAAETERAAIEMRRRAAEGAERVAVADARSAAAEKQAAADRQAAAETERATNEMRHRAAEIELAAVEMEDTARLSQRERTVRKLARAILAEAGGDAERLPLDAITDAYGVSLGTASSYRIEAAQLLADGYRPPKPRVAA